MPIDVRIVHEVAVVGNLAGLLNTPSHVDTAREIDLVLDDGHRMFIFELRGVGTPGPMALGVLATLTRRIRQRGGDVVLARVGRSTAQFLEELRMDAEWEIFRGLPEALDYFRRPGLPVDHSDNDAP